MPMNSTSSEAAPIPNRDAAGLDAHHHPRDREDHVDHERQREMAQRGVLNTETPRTGIVPRD